MVILLTILALTADGSDSLRDNRNPLPEPTPVQLRRDALRQPALRTPPSYFQQVEARMIPSNLSSEEPLALLENYYADLRAFGKDHPRLRARRELIRQLDAEAVHFEKSDLQKRHDRLSAMRKLLLISNGKAHPAVTDNATRLTLLDRLLEGKSAQVFQEVVTPVP
jgi:hypothetical protein